MDSKFLLGVLFFLFFPVVSFSQDSESSIQVEYQLYFDGDWPMTYPATLHVKKDITIYQTKPGLQREWNGGKIRSEKGEYPSERKVIEDDYLEMDYSKKEILFFDLLPSVPILVTDNFPEFDWQVYSDKKNIAGHPCIKAVANYRGRNWIAWFATDITIPYGPWKLHGLPGLILEAYDADKRYVMTANQVQFIKSSVFNKDFTTLIHARNKKPVSYKQFLADRQEAIENMLKQINQSSGEELTLGETQRTGMELKYEWE